MKLGLTTSEIKMKSQSNYILFLALGFSYGHFFVWNKRDGWMGLNDMLLYCLGSHDSAVSGSYNVIPTLSNCTKVNLNKYCSWLGEWAEYYTLSQKTCDYIFYNNFNNRCPITIISGIVISKSMRHQKMVSFPTSPI